MSIITLTGPTAAGKSSIERELQALGCGRAISHTTRKPRINELAGVHYHYVSDSEYDALGAAGEFIETITLGTRRYAMSKTALNLASIDNKHTAIVVDPHGAEQIRHYCAQQRIPAYSFWIDCGPKEQAQRFMARTIEDVMDEKRFLGDYMGSAHGAAAERLGIMLTEEAQWRIDAAGGKIQATGRYRYHHRIISTREHTPLDYATQVLEIVNAPASISLRRGELPMAFINRPDLH